MADPLPPQTFFCASECGWKLTTPDEVADSPSDVTDSFLRCPKCASRVRSRDGTALEVLGARVKRALRYALAR